MRISGVPIETVSCGEALEERAKIERGLIITANMMSGCYGLDVVERLRARNVDTPVLLCTGDLDVDKERALAAGANGYLSKPFTIEALCDAVHDLYRG